VDWMRVSNTEGCAVAGQDAHPSVNVSVNAGVHSNVWWVVARAWCEDTFRRARVQALASHLVDGMPAARSAFSTSPGNACSVEMTESTAPSTSSLLLVTGAVNAYGVRNVDIPPCPHLDNHTTSTRQSEWTPLVRQHLTLQQLNTMHTHGIILTHDCLWTYLAHTLA